MPRSRANDRLPDDNRKLVDGAASLEHLLLDVRAGPVHSFELTFADPIHVTVLSDQKPAAQTRPSGRQPPRCYNARRFFRRPPSRASLSRR